MRDGKHRAKLPLVVALEVASICISINISPQQLIGLGSSHLKIQEEAAFLLYQELQFKKAS
jgi:hypothetical protein